MCFAKTTKKNSKPATPAVARTGFDFGEAKWKEFKFFLRNHDWSTLMPDDVLDKAAFDFTELLFLHAKRFSPVKVVKGKPYKHAWIDETCRRLLKEKHDAAGTASFSDAQRQTHG